LYVFGTSVAEWNRLFDALRSCEWKVTFQLEGVEEPLPESAAACFAEGDRWAMLSIVVGGVLLNCHFFTENEIEFDLDPREVDGQERLDSVAAFMSFLADVTEKTLSLTYENCPEYARCTSEPRSSAFDCEALPHRPPPKLSATHAHPQRASCCSSART
jgi:hypothetical protein